MKLNLLLGLALCAPALLNAGELTVVHSTAGSFSAEMEAALTEAGLTAADVTKLIVTGEADMTAADFTPIRSSLKATLQEIDLSQAKFKNNLIVGSDTYGQSGPLNNMTELTKAVLPEGLAGIGGGTFSGCLKLTDVYIPSTVKNIYHYAFDKCAKLAITKLPESLVRVYPYAFRECSAMEVSSLPETLEEVQSYGFQKCTNLTASVFPASLKTLQEGAFASSGVRFSEWTETLTSIGKSAFSGTKVTFTEWTPYVATLPVGIFGYCYSITDFTLPEDITAIPKTAFLQNANYTERSFTCRNLTPPTASNSNNWEDSFVENSNYYNKITMRVKKEAVEAYSAFMPYSKMNIVALTTELPVVVEGEGTVTAELGDPVDGMLPVYEGNTVITLTPGDGLEISSVKYGEADLEVTDNTVTIDVPQHPETLTVVFATGASVEKISADEAKITYDSNSITVKGYEGLIELYGVNGNLLGSTYGSVMNISDLPKGIYLVRAGNVRAKILKR